MKLHILLTVILTLLTAGLCSCASTSEGTVDLGSQAEHAPVHEGACQACFELEAAWSTVQTADLDAAELALDSISLEADDPHGSTYAGIAAVVEALIALRDGDAVTARSLLAGLPDGPVRRAMSQTLADLDIHLNS